MRSNSFLNSAAASLSLLLWLMKMADMACNPGFSGSQNWLGAR